MFKRKRRTKGSEFNLVRSEGTVCSRKEEEKNIDLHAELLIEEHLDVLQRDVVRVHLLEPRVDPDGDLCTFGRDWQRKVGETFD